MIGHAFHLGDCVLATGPHTNTPLSTPESSALVTHSTCLLSANLGRLILQLRGRELAPVKIPGSDSSYVSLAAPIEPGTVLPVCLGGDGTSSFQTQEAAFRERRGWFPWGRTWQETQDSR